MMAIKRCRTEYGMHVVLLERYTGGYNSGACKLVSE